MFGGGNNIPDEVWRDVIKEVDENNDGMVIFLIKKL
jgi:hypothetical protein